MIDEAKLSAGDKQARRLAEALRRQFGPLECQVLQEPGVFELMLNPDGWLRQSRHRSSMKPSHYPEEMGTWPRTDACCGQRVAA